MGTHPPLSTRQGLCYHPLAMTLLALTVTSFVVALSGALAPGPVFAVTVVQSIRRGFRAGPLIVVGHAVLEFALILLLIAGLGTWLQRPAVSRVLGLVGGGILVLFGLLTLAGSRRATLEGSATTAPGSLVASGILVSLSNPYWSLWWAGIGLTYLAYALPFGVIGVVLFFLGHISADLLWFSLVSFSVSRGRRLFSPPVYRLVMAACGLFLLGFGLFLVLRRPA
jgi:threonine/homoserine/homoserine lactone efflux protein